MSKPPLTAPLQGAQGWDSYDWGATYRSLQYNDDGRPWMYCETKIGGVYELIVYMSFAGKPAINYGKEIDA